jgi:hypothetical protein
VCTLYYFNNINPNLTLNICGIKNNETKPLHEFAAITLILDKKKNLININCSAKWLLFLKLLIYNLKNQFSDRILIINFNNQYFSNWNQFELVIFEYINNSLYKYNKYIWVPTICDTLPIINFDIKIICLDYYWIPFAEFDSIHLVLTPFI